MDMLKSPMDRYVLTVQFTSYTELYKHKQQEEEKKSDLEFHGCVDGGVCATL